MQPAGAESPDETPSTARPDTPRRIPRRRAATPNGSRKMTRVFKALSDNTRQEILQILDGEQCTVSEIVSRFDLSQPTISRHLSVLKQAELVVDRRRGQNIIYRLNDRTLTSSMRQFFGRFRSCQEALR